MTVRETVLGAFALALSSHPDKARALLRDSPVALETEEGLDLLARIELALGNETEARRLWACAGGSRSRCALDALDSVEWRYRRLIRALRILIRIAIPLLLGYFISTLFLSHT